MKTKFQKLVAHNLNTEKWNFALALVCTLVVAVTDLLRPWPLKLIIDNILLGKPLPQSIHSLTTFWPKRWLARATTASVASIWRARTIQSVFRNQNPHEAETRLSFRAPWNRAFLSVVCASGFI